MHAQSSAPYVASGGCQAAALSAAVALSLMPVRAVARSSGPRQLPSAAAVPRAAPPGADMAIFQNPIPHLYRLSGDLYSAPATCNKLSDADGSLTYPGNVGVDIAVLFMRSTAGVIRCMYDWFYAMARAMMAGEQVWDQIYYVPATIVSRMAAAALQMVPRYTHGRSTDTYGCST